MSDYGVIGGKLAAICAVAALVLGLVNAVTEPVIAERKALELQDALSRAAGGATVGEELPAEGDPAVRAVYPTSNPDGYVLRLGGAGYGGDLELVAAYRPDGELTSAVLMDNQETPGLGKKAENPGYMDMFVGSGGSSGRPVPVRKDQLAQEQADAVTGATITFMGVARALETGSEYVRQQSGGAK